ncbi:MAG TPA: hypothetical protein VNJ01_10930 [Bacteriovoracaceae bacterium]|nr:hypothetical protein [Bacteriovoracaceae bacterium]
MKILLPLLLMSLNCYAARSDDLLTKEIQGIGQLLAAPNNLGSSNTCLEAEAGMGRSQIYFIFDIPRWGTASLALEKIRSLCNWTGIRGSLKKGVTGNMNCKFEGTRQTAEGPETYYETHNVNFACTRLDNQRISDADRSTHDGRINMELSDAFSPNQRATEPSCTFPKGRMVELQ